SKGTDDIPNKETELTKLFKKYGVVAVFSGHDHGYYRTVRNGIPYFISAGGGALVYASKRASEATAGDAYYFGKPDTYSSGKPEDRRFVLHRSDGTEKITATQDLFLIVVDVDGDKIVAKAMSTKDELWDEYRLK